MEKHTRKRKNDTVNEKPATKQKCMDLAGDADEEQLSRILFGGSSTFLESLEEAERETSKTKLDPVVDSGIGETDSDGSDASVRKPAWVDDDDGIDVGHALQSQKRRLPKGGINSSSNHYKDLLNHKFTSIVGTPTWAELDNKGKTNSEDSEDDDILQTCGFIPKGTASKFLPAKKLEFKKVKDLNCETYTEGPYINSIEFHPTSTVSLVAGQAGIVTLYAVDGKRNNKLHSVKFDKFPVLCAKFTPDGHEAIVGSRKSHFFSYDLISAKSVRISNPSGLTQMKKFIISPTGKYIAVAGKWGEIHVLHLQTKERLFMLKQDSEVSALTFNNSGSLLYGHSDTGEITIFDMTAQRIAHKFIDEGCLQGTAISLSPSNQFLATGSAQGVVNLYQVDSLRSTKTPQPQKSIFNLVTSISDLQFNSTSELLAMASADIQNAVKLFHVESNTIFNNFPTFSNKLGFVSKLNLSPASGYLALGNTKSTVALYRLKHFKNY